MMMIILGDCVVLDFAITKSKLHLVTPLFEGGCTHVLQWVIFRGDDLPILLFGEQCVGFDQIR